MRRITFAVLGGLAVTLWVGNGAGAQTSMNAFSAVPNAPAYRPMRGLAPVAPAMPGGGGTYGYVPQNLGQGMGMSPNAYYSANYYAAASGAATGPNLGNPNAGYVAPPPAVVNPGVTTYYPTQGTTYAPQVATGPAATYPTYAGANASYYRTRRVGPLRRMFGGR